MKVAYYRDKKLDALPKKTMPTFALAAVIFGIAGLSALVARTRRAVSSVVSPKRRTISSLVTSNCFGAP